MTNFSREWPQNAPFGTVGVEEEYFLVDPVTGACVPSIDAVLDGCARAEAEIVQEVVETGTHVCAGDAELLDAMLALRTSISDGARSAGCEIVATGTHPSTAPADVTLTPRRRYESLRSNFPWVWREAFTCGMHVHVGMRDAEDAVRVCDAMRRYLPTLLAISANSPLWRGEDTGLSSVRGQLVQLYVRSGMPPRLGSWDEYVQLMDGLVARGIGDGSWSWWFVRPHSVHGTVEVRICDPQTDVRDAHALASLVRAMCMRLARDGDDPALWVSDPSDLLLEQTMWNAVHEGPDGACLVTADTGRTFGDHALELVEQHADVLDDDVVARLRAIATAPAAQRQRDAYASSGGDVAAVVRDLVERTRCTEPPATPAARAGQLATS